MKTFLICPVREHSPEETRNIVEQLEKEGWEVHWPHRDTNQNDKSGLRICRDNRKAIREADAVHIVYNPESQGSHFDMGMAFMAEKLLHIVFIPKYDKEKKSYPHMLSEWEKETA